MSDPGWQQAVLRELGAAETGLADLGSAEPAASAHLSATALSAAALRDQPGPGSPDELLRRIPHGDPLRRRMARGVRRAVGTAQADADGVPERLRVPVPSCRTIAVTSIRGGAGKTTVAALLGAVLAGHRDDRVLAVDADSGLGSLQLRTGISARHSMRELAMAQPASWEEAEGYLQRTAAGLWVLSSTVDGQMSELDVWTFRAATGGVGRYFSTAVVDCGAGVTAALQRGVLAGAHAQVFVAPATADGALSARQALGWLLGTGGEDLINRTVVALVAHSPHAEEDADLERARQSLGTLPTGLIPYDRHLAAGTAITAARVSGAVRAAASWLAAEAFDRALSTGVPV